MNPYKMYVSRLTRVANGAKSAPLGGFKPARRPRVLKSAPQVLLFSPHPDDECVVGALPLRILREMRFNVVNVAVTLGSRKDRQAARLQELANACQYVGFALVLTREGGLEKVNPRGRAEDAAMWAESVRIIAGILAEHRPKIIFIPHDQDWNTTHIGTHLLVMDALQSLGAGFSCHVVETEYWQPMSHPNLMIEVSGESLAELMTGVSFHVGEVQRNPYHLEMPAWMMDNVRRGAELVGGQGASAPSYLFGCLYRVRTWANGQIADAFSGGRFVSLKDPLAAMFP
jgi:LmbE family N-acetylglucosaminyl deacetylase